MLDEVNAGLNASEIDGALAPHPPDRRTRRDHPRHRASDEGRAVARRSACWCCTTASSSPRAARPRSCATRASSRPIWARSSRAASARRRPVAEPLLTIERLSAGYGDVRVLWDISLARRGRRDRLHRRLERRRQDHPAADDFRPGAGHARAAFGSAARTSRRWPPTRSSLAASPMFRKDDGCSAA